MNPEELGTAMRDGAVWCERLGSPLYRALLLSLAENVESRGVSWDLLQRHARDPARSLLPLRFLAAIHRLVLEGRLPELARYYPSAGGKADGASAWIALLGQMERNEEVRSVSVPPTVQTNEVARSCALAPGFLEIAHRTGLPLRLLEIGCSAGLNLRWDRYRYETSRGAWGDARSGVTFHDAFAGPAPVGVAVHVIERRGCDLNPIEPATEDGRLTLLSFIWPDQIERFRQLSSAIEIARVVPAVLERADAPDWLDVQLASPGVGAATVVVHSLVLLYLSPEARERVIRILTEAGGRATREAPLAWLSMEPGATETDVHLTFWPGGQRRLIARAGYHGRNVTILAADAN
jgi:hypothetical protein